jgi:hypothetical protein
MNVFEKMKNAIEYKKSNYNELLHGLKLIYKLELITDVEYDNLYNLLWDKIRG